MCVRAGVATGAVTHHWSHTHTSCLSLISLGLHAAESALDGSHDHAAVARVFMNVVDAAVCMCQLDAGVDAACARSDAMPPVHAECSTTAAAMLSICELFVHLLRGAIPAAVACMHSRLSRCLTAALRPRDGASAAAVKHPSRYVESQGGTENSQQPRSVESLIHLLFAASEAVMPPPAPWRLMLQRCGAHESDMDAIVRAAHFMCFIEVPASVWPVSKAEALALVPQCPCAVCAHQAPLDVPWRSPLLRALCEDARASLKARDMQYRMALTLGQQALDSPVSWDVHGSRVDAASDAEAAEVVEHMVFAALMHHAAALPQGARAERKEAIGIPRSMQASAVAAHSWAALVRVWLVSLRHALQADASSAGSVHSSDTNVSSTSSVSLGASADAAAARDSFVNACRVMCDAAAELCLLPAALLSHSALTRPAWQSTQNEHSACKQRWRVVCITVRAIVRFTRLASDRFVSIFARAPPGRPRLADVLLACSQSSTSGSAPRDVGASVGVDAVSFILGRLARASNDARISNCLPTSILRLPPASAVGTYVSWVRANVQRMLTPLLSVDACVRTLDWLPARAAAGVLQGAAPSFALLCSSVQLCATPALQQYFAHPSVQAAAVQYPPALCDASRSIVPLALLLQATHDSTRSHARRALERLLPCVAARLHQVVELSSGGVPKRDHTLLPQLILPLVCCTVSTCVSEEVRAQAERALCAFGRSDMALHCRACSDTAIASLLCCAAHRPALADAQSRAQRASLLLDASLHNAQRLARRWSPVSWTDQCLHDSDSVSAAALSLLSAASMELHGPHVLGSSPAFSSSPPAARQQPAICASTASSFFCWLQLVAPAAPGLHSILMRTRELPASSVASERTAALSALLPQRQVLQWLYLDTDVQGRTHLCVSVSLPSAAGDVQDLLLHTRTHVHTRAHPRHAHVDDCIQRWRHLAVVLSVQKSTSTMSSTGVASLTLFLDGVACDVDSAAFRGAPELSDAWLMSCGEPPSRSSATYYQMSACAQAAQQRWGASRGALAADVEIAFGSALSKLYTYPGALRSEDVRALCQRTRPRPLEESVAAGGVCLEAWLTVAWHTVMDAQRDAALGQDVQRAVSGALPLLRLAWTPVACALLYRILAAGCTHPGVHLRSVDDALLVSVGVRDAVLTKLSARLRLRSGDTSSAPGAATMLALAVLCSFTGDCLVDDKRAHSAALCDAAVLAVSPPLLSTHGQQLAHLIRHLTCKDERWQDAWNAVMARALNVMEEYVPQAVGCGDGDARAPS
ncbi:hypothetical protein EON66_01815, partial [archaeon]